MVKKKEPSAAAIQITAGTKIVLVAKFGEKLRSDRLLGPYDRLEIWAVKWPEER